MKKFILCTLGLFILLTSCKKEVYLLEVVDEQLVPDYSSISVQCKLYTTAVTWYADVCISTEEDFSWYMSIPLQEDNGTYYETITELQEGTTYYIRYGITTSDNTSVISDKISTVTTLARTVPTVLTSSVSDITGSSATVEGIVEFDGGEEVTGRGVVYGTNPEPTLQDNVKWSHSKDSVYSVCLDNLSDGTVYYVRAFATNSLGTAYGEELSFTTEAFSVPTVSTLSIDNVGSSSATVNCEVSLDGGARVTERGIVFSTSPNPTIEDNKQYYGSGTGAFTANLTGLSELTTYYVRAYATNSKGTSYGEELTFTTTEFLPPTVVTTAVSNVSFSSADVDGSVVDNGGTSLIEYGVVYGTNPHPTTNDRRALASYTTYTINLKNLSELTTYYVRAYATNSKGTSYGEELSFTTTGSENGHEWIDLGLSVKWASCNVGASTPEDFGDYFAWAETREKSTYDWSTYIWCNTTSEFMYKYNHSSSTGIVDKKTILDRSDDAAAVNLGGKWRVPSYDEFTELIEKCTWVSTTLRSVRGFRITGPSGNSIFLPAAGYNSDSYGLMATNMWGQYWSNEVNTVYSPTAKYLTISYLSESYHVTSGFRYIGQSIRPVCP